MAGGVASPAQAALLVALGVVAAVALHRALRTARDRRCAQPQPAPAPPAANPTPAAPPGSIAAALADVRARIAALTAELGRARPPLLVAVSKTKPAELLREAYDAGQRTFGENYVQELVDKAPELPADCAWHFIGHLQSNKARVLCAVPNLARVESVDSEKIANALDKACAARAQPLSVLVQVNSSGEDSKYGIEPARAAALVRHVRERCPHLRCDGLMTIGALDYSPSPECLRRMLACRAAVASELGLDEASLELSMGMSADYESAIRLGSTSVRVGSTIFGARAQKQPR